MNNGWTSGFGYLNGISDLDWRIVGTGDFNRDGRMDILWRNYGLGEYSGWNVIWYMDGEGIAGFGYLNGISDLDWQIVGDGRLRQGRAYGHPVALLRERRVQRLECHLVYESGRGSRASDISTRISDTSWQIAGTGDYDSDGDMDILWRYYGSGEYQGWNCHLVHERRGDHAASIIPIPSRIQAGGS